ncbi:MAG: hypothetical protein V2A77_11015, partial [Pseudomonadota bacterium]
MVPAPSRNAAPEPKPARRRPCRVAALALLLLLTTGHLCLAGEAEREHGTATEGFKVVSIRI